MSTHAYPDDQLVEQPAIGLYPELGWATVSALEESLDATRTLLRETKGEVNLLLKEGIKGSVPESDSTPRHDPDRGRDGRCRRSLPLP